MRCFSIAQRPILLDSNNTNQQEEFILASGSQDMKVRLWDIKRVSIISSNQEENNNNDQKKSDIMIEESYWTTNEDDLMFFLILF